MWTSFLDLYLVLSVYFKTYLYFQPLKGAIDIVSHFILGGTNLNKRRWEYVYLIFMCSY